MPPANIVFSDDQAETFDSVAELLCAAGADITSALIKPQLDTKARLMAVIGKAGSGKTLLLAQLYRALVEAGLTVISDEYEARLENGARSLAILAPTNKAANVLRSQGVPATTLHRILYTPVYDPEFERVAQWLTGTRERPELEGVSDETLDKALAFYKKNKSVYAALMAMGLKGSDFITGWKRRNETLDIGFVDESSMLDADQLDDLKEIFPTLVLFGDPAQLAPVKQSGKMVFDSVPQEKTHILRRIHRQTEDNPILDLAHALADPQLTFSDFESNVKRAAARDSRVVYSRRVEADYMARSPVLVWRNKTRVRLIQAFRRAYDAPEHELLMGEPLICDGIELPVKHRKKRLDLEARGLIKGAQVIYEGVGKRPGFSRLFVMGAADPQVSVASIVKIESPNEEEPMIPFAARMGAVFLHGAAVTIHKAQGSQWDVVQVYAPDIQAAAFAGRTEAGIPLWKRLAYVAITRAQNRLIWVVNNRLAKPSEPLRTDDLRHADETHKMQMTLT